MEDRNHRPFVCEICELSFTSKQFLQRHYAVHTDERNFKCEICTHSYKYKKGLNRHYKKYHGKLYKSLIGPRNEQRIPSSIPLESSFKKRKLQKPEKFLSIKKLQEISDSFIVSKIEDELNWVKQVNDSKIFTASAFPSDKSK
jgi:uncharacterized Zn-finger protein